MRKIEPLLSPSKFVGIDGVTHLCSGGESPWLKCQEEVYELFAHNKSLSYQGRDTLLGMLKAVGKRWASSGRLTPSVSVLWLLPPKV